MKRNDKLALILLKNPFPLLIIIFAMSFKAYLSIISPIIKFFPLGFLVSLLITELVLRVLMLFLYGKKYIYRFRPFYIERNKICGYKFKNNLNSSKVDFSIYERDAFPSNTKIPINKNENKNLRVRFSTDRLGFRINPYPYSCKEKNIKIICSGGSTTAGCGINNEDTWPNKLKEKLNKNGYNSEVVNAGVYGFDSFQELQNIKHNIIKIKPNIILLHQGWNEEFEFSALTNGKQFRPNHARGYFEKFYFFTNNIPFLPYRSLFFFLSYRYIRRKICLERNMNFNKERRWSALLNDQYIKNWYDNIFEIKKICERNNIRLFLVDYPCLVNNYDTEEDRKIYIDNSRLTDNFAAYQAFSKSRIEEFYLKISKYFDILEGNILFNKIRGKSRIDLFSDEIHLSAKGEDLLAESIFKSLVKELEVNNTGKNNSLKRNEFLKLRKSIGINSSELNIDIRRYITKNLSQGSNDNLTIPTDIYTTS